ncbi:hypothetical protein ABTJ85_19075, partial [Acinetobacter baumannii]
YTYDRHLPGMLHGRILRSPHAHARVVRVDTSEAQRMPGVRAIVNLAERGDYVVRFMGDPVAAVAATTPEIAEDAIRAIKV